jgi:hypothetical protein
MDFHRKLPGNIGRRANPTLRELDGLKKYSQMLEPNDRIEKPGIKSGLRF